MRMLLLALFLGLVPLAPPALAQKAEDEMVEIKGDAPITLRPDRAYFLLRDGEIFHRVYEAVVGVDSPCPVRTLHSSRRAMIFPLFGRHAELVVPQLLAGVGKRPVGDYLARIGVDPVPLSRSSAPSATNSTPRSTPGLVSRR